MKPKQLKSPFTWEARHPLLRDRVLYVPHYYDRHEEYLFPGWASSEVFGREAPIEVEYCAGNGEWIVAKALAHPERNWVAVEFQFERARKIWSKIHNLQLSNLLVVCGEALTFTKYYVQAGTFSASYVNFPDPWPKPRHEKKRLLQEPFFLELARASQEGSIATLVTDHAGYVTQIVEVLEKLPPWSSCHPFPHYITDYPGYGTSYFDSLWREQGLDVHYIQYENGEKR
jgi:tRNA (guanine-N7-)-methyltransferase